MAATANGGGGGVLPTGSALLHIGTDFTPDLAAEALAAEPLAAEELPAKGVDAFNRWCEEHLRSNMSLPGFVAARRFARDESWRGAGESAAYLTLYDLEAESALESEAYRSHDQSVPVTFAARLRFARSVYREIGSQRITQSVGSAILHVTVDVDPLHTDAFLRWYADEHVPAVLEAPGMIAARRFENILLSAGQPLPQGQHSYCTLYEMEDAAVVGRPETLAASERGACPPELEPHRVAHNRVYRKIFQIAR